MDRENKIAAPELRDFDGLVSIYDEARRKAVAMLPPVSESRYPYIEVDVLVDPLVYREEQKPLLTSYPNVIKFRFYKEVINGAAVGWK